MTMKVGNGLDLQGQRIQNMGDPSSTSDAATKAYVDGVVNGLQWKAPVRVASTANLAVASAVVNAAVVDGVTLATGDRILLKNQTTASENGIYVVVASGAAPRAADMDSTAECRSATVFVAEGTANGDKAFTQTAEIATIGTTSQNWVQFGGGGSTYTAGDGLTESPTNTFNVNTGTGLETSADTVRIAASAAGAGLTGGGGSALAVNAGTASATGLETSGGTVRIATAAAGAGLTGGGGSALSIASSAAGAGLTLTSGVLDVVGDSSITVSANSLGLASGVAGNGLTLTSGVLDVVGGTGITASANSIAVSSVVVRQYAAAIGDGSTTNIVVTHNLGTQDIQVTVRNASSPFEQVLVDNEATTTNTATLRFATAPTTNQYRVIVQGAS